MLSRLGSTALAALALHAGPSLGQALSDPQPAGRIEEARFVELGGIEQWVTIRGDDARNPVLLLVHGGPGDVQSPLVETYAPYEHDFVLVQWDQRGAGKTYQRHGDATPEITLDRISEDGIELAEHLRERLGVEGIVAFGHSWGSAVAMEMVLRRPELFSAYVGTGQIASWPEMVRWQFDFLLQRARRTGDRAIVAELEAIGAPDPTDAATYFRFMRSLRSHFSAPDAEWLAGLLELARASMTEGELEASMRGMTLSGRSLLPFMLEQDYSTRALRYEVPFYVIQGRDDLATPTEPAIAYFERVQAPRKRLVIIESAGHFALATHRDEVIAALRAVLEPNGA